MHVNDLLTIAVEQGASDLHLKVGSCPMMYDSEATSASGQPSRSPFLPLTR